MAYKTEDIHEKALLEKFEQFKEKNPLEYSEEQLKIVKEDIESHKSNIVSDEYVDFILWSKGLRSRQEYFAYYIEKILPVDKYRKLLEVGCGRDARLSKLLSEKGYQMTAMDPKIMNENADSEGVYCINDSFIFKETDITKYDAVIAQEPCEATEHIVRECVAECKNFVIVLCGVQHKLMNGEMPENVWEWYNYLENIDREHCIWVSTKIIPGYSTCVIKGTF